MPCPYAERRGVSIYCKAAGRKVNPLAFPCLTNRYKRCRYYREPEPEKPQEQKEPAKAETRPARKQPQVTIPTLEYPSVTPRASPRGEVKGITIDGRKPRDCTECIYYGARTRTCLLLGVTVQDPRDPPCAKT